MKDTLLKLVDEYFDYTARRFPVMCASDEFHFMPRAQAASLYYDRLDDLSPDGIEESRFQLKEFQKRCDIVSRHEKDLESVIDLEMLKANIAGILIEFETKASWRYNPLLYLKIAFIGLDHALTKPASGKEERMERTSARLNAMPKLFSQAGENIDTIPEGYMQASLAMIGDCKAYIEQIGRWLSGEKTGSGLVTDLGKILFPLISLEKRLHGLAPIPNNQFQVISTLETTVKDHFLSARDLEEVFQIGRQEFRDCLEDLKKVRSEIDPSIDPNRTWQELYHGYNPTEVSDLDTLSLYKEEADRLTSFFAQRGLGSPDSGRRLKVVETPLYLSSVRGSASFSAAFSADCSEEDLFYITTSDQGKDLEAGRDLRKRLHREYKFLAAHETVPGHHLLDSVRRSLKNPVRRQIESPLFYEGWAYYTESLLGEYGYVKNPIERLVDLKRRLWRAARCQVDVGLNTGRLAKGNAIELLATAGFSRKEAEGQVERFRLNPGYQLCYTLGRYEIVRLRRQYTNRMTLDQFHRRLLEGGELPFHLIERRLEKEKKN